MKYIIAGGVAAIAVLAIAWYFLFYPPVVLKRETAKALQAIGQAVATKDRAKISDAFRAALADDAKIRLEVSMISLSRPTGGNALTQDFDKTAFIAFVDNVLYPLTDYSYEPKLDSFELAPDRQSAAVTFSSFEWADGANYYGGIAVNMRFSSNSSCTGQASFDGAAPRLKQAACTMQMRVVPKPGEEGKLREMLLKDMNPIQ